MAKSASRRGRSRGRAIGLAHRRKALEKAQAEAAPFKDMSTEEANAAYEADQHSSPQETNGEAVNHLKTFESHGVVFYRQDEHEHKAACPFCGKKAFSVNDKEGLFKCWDCGKQGNKYTFLQFFYDFWFQTTNATHYKALAALRNLPAETFSHAELAWDRKRKRWLIPIRNAKGSMVNLRHWSPEPRADGGKPFLMNTAGCKAHLYNLDRWVSDAPFAVICEGEWDAIALDWLLSKAGVNEVSVVSVPGADIFKEEWAQQFINKIVFILYDNDDAGRRGVEKVSGLLRKHTKCKELHRLAWPESYPDKYDVGDFVGKSVSDGKKPKRAWIELKKMLEDMPLHDAKQEYALKRTKFSEVVKDFSEHIFLTKELTDALAITIGTVLSMKLLKDPYTPIWMFLTGPSGSGKTLVLQSVSGNEEVICRDKLTANALVSAYKTADGSDASLIPQLIGKTFIMKDWTVVQRLPSGDQEQIHSIMRVAFDGNIDGSSGIGVSRSYPDPNSGHKTCHYSFLSGVTDSIYLENRTDVGERTLKYRVLEGTEDIWNILEASADNTLQNKVPEELLRASANAFLDHCLTGRQHDIPGMSQEMKQGIMGLAQMACVCGTNVYRKQGDVLMPPSPAVASRMTKQMIKLAQCLAFLFDKKAVDDECYRIIKRVGLSTCYGWGVKALMAIFAKGDKGILRDEVMAKASMKSATTQRVLEDLLELEAVTFEIESRDEKGQPPRRWFISPTMQKYLAHAKLKPEDLMGMPKALPRKRPGTARRTLNGVVSSPRKVSQSTKPLDSRSRRLAARRKKK